jgi:hydroxylamine reductase
MTSNGIQEPTLRYKNRIFTSGAVAWPEVVHVADQNFAPVIAAALQAPGHAKDGSHEEITVGFGHNAVPA